MQKSVKKSRIMSKSLWTNNTKNRLCECLNRSAANRDDSDDLHQLPDDGAVSSSAQNLKLTIQNEMMIEHPELIDDRAAIELGMEHEKDHIAKNGSSSFQNSTDKNINELDHEQLRQKPQQNLTGRILISKEKTSQHILAIQVAREKSRNGNCVCRITPEEADILLKRKWVPENKLHNLVFGCTKNISDTQLDLPRVVKSYQRRAQATESTHSLKSKVQKSRPEKNSINSLDLKSELEPKEKNIESNIKKRRKTNASGKSPTKTSLSDEHNQNLDVFQLPQTQISSSTSSNKSISANSTQIYSNSSISTTYNNVVKIFPGPNNDRSAIKKARLALFTRAAKKSNLNKNNVVIPAVNIESNSQTGKMNSNCTSSQNSENFIKPTSISTPTSFGTKKIPGLKNVPQDEGSEKVNLSEQPKFFDTPTVGKGLDNQLDQQSQESVLKIQTDPYIQDDNLQSYFLNALNDNDGDILTVDQQTNHLDKNYNCEKRPVLSCLTAMSPSFTVPLTVSTESLTNTIGHYMAINQKNTNCNQAEESNKPEGRQDSPKYVNELSEPDMRNCIGITISNESSSESNSVLDIVVKTQNVCDLKEGQNNNSNNLNNNIVGVTLSRLGVPKSTYTRYGCHNGTKFA